MSPARPRPAAGRPRPAALRGPPASTRTRPRARRSACNRAAVGPASGRPRRCARARAASAAPARAASICGATGVLWLRRPRASNTRLCAPRSGVLGQRHLRVGLGLRRLRRLVGELRAVEALLRDRLGLSQHAGAIEVDLRPCARRRRRVQPPRARPRSARRRAADPRRRSAEHGARAGQPALRRRLDDRHLRAGRRRLRLRGRQLGVGLLDARPRVRPVELDEQDRRVSPAGCREWRRARPRRRRGPTRARCPPPPARRPSLSRPAVSSVYPPKRRHGDRRDHAEDHERTAAAPLGARLVPSRNGGLRIADVVAGDGGR